MTYDFNKLKKEYKNQAYNFALFAANGDVAKVIEIESRLTSADVFDPFLDEIRRKHRDEEVDWFDFTNEEVENKLSDEELADYCNFLTHLIDELEEREK